MKHLDLFSGIGGFALAATWVWGNEYENIGHSEVEKYPCQVYHNHFPESECLGDITKIDWSRFAGQIDLVTGGFPCQPHSVAGKRKGSADERDLWAECVRAIREIRPRFALFENVPGLFSSNGGRFFQRVLTDIHESGYDAEWQVLSAAEVGAWHKRDRVWITAYPNIGRLERPAAVGRDSIDVVRDSGVGSKADVPYTESDDAGRDTGELSRADEQQESKRQEERISELGSSSAVPDTPLQQIDQRERRDLAEATSGGQGFDTTVKSGCEDVSDRKATGLSLCAIRQGQRESWRSYQWGKQRWNIESDVCRVANGIPNRVERLKGLGNAIVPQVAAVIMERIKQST